MRPWFRSIFLLGSIVPLASTASGQGKASRDGYFSPHDLCEVEIVKAEKEYGIPHQLFMAMGAVESGRLVNSSQKRPYPWTICVGGKSYYFSSKNAAITSVRKLLAQGKRNIDVGCMQVNLLHHSDAFKSLEEAFTPKDNVAYAAKFFVELRNMYHSWTHAVGYYHSRSAKYYKPYCKTVYNAWKNAEKQMINVARNVKLAASRPPSEPTIFPLQYSLTDDGISARLHQLGRKTLRRGTPKFFTNNDD